MKTEDRYYTVKLEIEAPSKEYIERMLEGMPHCDRIFDEEITGEEDKELQGRIRYVEDWNGRGEYYLFETKWSDEETWGLDMAFHLLDHEGEKGVLLSYQALTKVRSWMNVGVNFWFE